ncbi:MAG: hypothetical protein RIR00_2205 [Pseudomonadota bacterium]|jgi:ribosome-associated protein
MKHDELPESGRPSKTRRKAEMHELQELGEALVGLSVGQMKKIELQENLYEAVRDYQRFPSHEAKRRQLQYIGKLMRGIDPEPIRAGLALLRGESSEEIAKLHQLERLRSELLADEKTLERIVATWPRADLTLLRQLRRNALKEQELGKPPRNFRQIFQTLKELSEHDDEPLPEDDDA